MLAATSRELSMQGAQLSECFIAASNVTRATVVRLLYDGPLCARWKAVRLIGDIDERSGCARRVSSQDSSSRLNASLDRRWICVGRSNENGVGWMDGWMDGRMDGYFMGTAWSGRRERGHNTARIVWQQLRVIDQMLAHQLNNENNFIIQFQICNPCIFVFLSCSRLPSSCSNSVIMLIKIHKTTRSVNRRAATFYFLAARLCVCVLNSTQTHSRAARK